MVSFAIPCLALPLADPCMSLIDTVCIGKCGTALELAAMGPATLLFGAVSTLFGAFSATTISTIAQLLAWGMHILLRVYPQAGPCLCAQICARTPRWSWLLRVHMYSKLFLRFPSVPSVSSHAKVMLLMWLRTGSETRTEPPNGQDTYVTGFMLGTIILWDVLDTMCRNLTQLRGTSQTIYRHHGSYEPSQIKACQDKRLQQWLTVTPLVLPFSPKYRLVHPENYLILISKKIFSGSNYPTNYFI